MQINEYDYDPPRCCLVCDGPNDTGEICSVCAKKYPGGCFDGNSECCGHWLVQDYYADRLSDF